MSEWDNDKLLDRLNNEILTRKLAAQNRNMSTEDIQRIITAAVSAALEQQRIGFEAKLQHVTDQLRATIVSTPEVTVYQPIKVEQGIECNECLDAVKSLPEFNGSQEQYVSW